MEIINKSDSRSTCVQKNTSLLAKVKKKTNDVYENNTKLPSGLHSKCRQRFTGKNRTLDITTEPRIQNILNNPEKCTGYNCWCIKARTQKSTFHKKVNIDPFTIDPASNAPPQSEQPLSSTYTPKSSSKSQSSKRKEPDEVDTRYSP